MSDTVVLHPDDVEVLRSAITGEVLGYRIHRELLKPSVPPPNSVPKLPQSIFNLDRVR